MISIISWLWEQAKDLLKPLGRILLGGAQDWLRSRRAQRLRSPEVAAFLVRYYVARREQDHLFRACIGTAARTIPFLTGPEWHGERARDRLRLVLTADADTELKLPRRLWVKRWLLGYQLRDNNVFMLRDITVDKNGPRVATSIGRYFQYVAACGRVEEELLRYLKSPSRGTPIRDEKLGTLKALAEAPLKAHAIGVHCMLVGRADTGWETLIQKRSSKTVTLGEWWSVVPTFAFQPLFDHPDREHDLCHQFFREYGEELLGIPELSGRSDNVEHNWFYVDTPVEPLVKQWRQNMVDVHVLGIGFDLVNCEPNVAMLVCIKDPTFWTNQTMHYRKTWEALRIDREPIAGDRCEQLLREDKLTPGSAFAMTEALRFLQAAPNE